MRRDRLTCQSIDLLTQLIGARLHHDRVLRGLLALVRWSAHGQEGTASRATNESCPRKCSLAAGWRCMASARTRPQKASRVRRFPSFSSMNTAIEKSLRKTDELNLLRGPHTIYRTEGVLCGETHIKGRRSGCRAARGSERTQRVSRLVVFRCTSYQQRPRRHERVRRCPGCVRACRM